jgi:hypothetical protein
MTADIWKDPEALKQELVEPKTEIVVSDAAITVKRRYGNNRLAPDREAEAVRLFMEGKTLNAIRKETGISSHTLIRIRKGLTLPDCARGRPAGHRGWCKVRFDASPARHKVIGRLTKKIRFNQNRFNRWKRGLIEANMVDANGDGLREGILLLAAINLRTFNERKLQLATGFDDEFIKTCCFNMRMNGIWRLDGKWTVDETFDPTSDAMLGVQFALWRLVASGEVTLVRRSDGEGTVRKGR